jgi:hypothetical protein
VHGTYEDLKNRSIPSERPGGAESTLVVCRKCCEFNELRGPGWAVAEIAGRTIREFLHLSQFLSAEKYADE